MKLSLNKTWQFCLRMWKWIADEKKNGRIKSVYNLKNEWLRKNGFKDVRIIQRCFFCDYANDECFRCPPRLINSSFDCMNNPYNWQYEPTKFYEKLVEINKKRLLLKKKGIKNVD